MSLKSRFIAQSGRAPYSAITFKDGDLYVAEDNMGAVIKESSVPSTTIQAALDNEVGRTFCLDGSYEIAAGISIPSHRTLEGESYKTIFEQPATPISELIKNDYSAGATNFQIKNLTLDGKSRGVDWKHGMWFQNISWFNIENIYGINFTGAAPTNSRNSLIVIGAEDAVSRLGMYGTIHNITADTVRGDVVYLTGKESQAAFSEYVNVYDVIGKNCTGNIVDFNEVQYSNINNITGYTVGESCVLVDGIHHCNISNITSYISKTGLTIGHHASGTTGVSSYNAFSNIISYYSTQNGIYVLNSSNNTISNFLVVGNAETGPAVSIYAVGAGTTDEGVATGNKFSNGIILTPNNEGVYINESTGSDDASFNTFDTTTILKTTGTSSYGFRSNAEHSSFNTCYAKGSKISKGFFLASTADNCKLTACEAYDVDDMGFSLEGENTILNGCCATLCDNCGFWSVGVRNAFTGCIAKDNGQDSGASYKDGFSFQGGYAHYSTLNGCIAVGNAAYGVRGHYSADYLLLIGNALTGNTSGSTNNLGTNSKAPTASNFL